MELSAFLWKCARFVQYTSLPPVSASSGLIRADRANLGSIEIEPAGGRGGRGRRWGLGGGGSVGLQNRRSFTCLVIRADAHDIYHPPHETLTLLRSSLVSQSLLNRETGHSLVTRQGTP